MKKNKQKNVFFIILIIFLLSTLLIITTTPLHEAAHWVMSEIDPFSEPVELHLFDHQSLKKGQHIVSKTLNLLMNKKYQIS